MGIVHRVDAAEAGQVAVLHIHAGDVVLTLAFCLGAVLLEVVHRGSRHPQAGVAAHDDLGIGTVQPEHIAVDDLAGEDETGNVVFRIDVHLADLCLEGRFHLTRKADLNALGQGLAVPAQQLFRLFGRAHPGIVPGKA